MDSNPDSAAKARQLAVVIARKALTLGLVTLVFGWLYAWASPWAYPRDRTAGFGFGALHGAMMPLSVASLVTGRDVPIYDENNSGRLYKLGYICGVNFCGFAFIGPLFWRAGKSTSANSGKSQ